MVVIDNKTIYPKLSFTEAINIFLKNHYCTEDNSLVDDDHLKRSIFSRIKWYIKYEKRLGDLVTMGKITERINRYLSSNGVNTLSKAVHYFYHKPSTEWLADYFDTNHRIVIKEWFKGLKTNQYNQPVDLKIDYNSPSSLSKDANYIFIPIFNKTNWSLMVAIPSSQTLMIYFLNTMIHDLKEYEDIHELPVDIRLFDDWKKDTYIYNDYKDSKYSIYYIIWISYAIIMGYNISLHDINAGKIHFIRSLVAYIAHNQNKNLLRRTNSAGEKRDYTMAPPIGAERINELYSALYKRKIIDEDTNNNNPLINTKPEIVSLDTSPVLKVSIDMMKQRQEQREREQQQQRKEHKRQKYKKTQHAQADPHKYPNYYLEKSDLIKKRARELTKKAKKEKIKKLKKLKRQQKQQQEEEEEKERIRQRHAQRSPIDVTQINQTQINEEIVKLRTQLKENPIVDPRGGEQENKRKTTEEEEDDREAQVQELIRQQNQLKKRKLEVEDLSSNTNNIENRIDSLLKLVTTVVDNNEKENKDDSKTVDDIELVDDDDNDEEHKNKDEVNQDENITNKTVEKEVNQDENITNKTVENKTDKVPVNQDTNIDNKSENKDNQEGSKSLFAKAEPTEIININEDKQKYQTTPTTAFIDIDHACESDGIKDIETIFKMNFYKREKIYSLSRFILHDVRGDGNCFFYALKFTLKYDSHITSEEETMDLRQACIDHLLDDTTHEVVNTYQLRNFVQVLRLAEDIEGMTNYQIKYKYIESLVDRTHFADNAEVLMISNILNLNINIYSILDKGDNIYIDVIPTDQNLPTESRRTVNVFFHEPRKHYYALITDETRTQKTTKHKCRHLIENYQIIESNSFI